MIGPLPALIVCAALALDVRTGAWRGSVPEEAASIAAELASSLAQQRAPR